MASKCPHCGEAFSRASSLKRHLLTICENDRYSSTISCDQCGKPFTRKDALRRHVEAHKEAGARRRVEACPLCSRVYRKDYMKTHINTCTKLTARNIAKRLRRERLDSTHAEVSKPGLTPSQWKSESMSTRQHAQHKRHAIIPNHDTSRAVQFVQYLPRGVQDGDDDILERFIHQTLRKHRGHEPEAQAMTFVKQLSQGLEVFLNNGYRPDDLDLAFIRGIGYRHFSLLSFAIITLENYGFAVQLLSWGFDHELPEGFELTLLHCAVTAGREDLVNLLLDKGAEIDAIDYEGRTPLYRAVSDGLISIARLLLRTGADVNVGKPIWSATRRDTAMEMSKMLLEAISKQ